MMESSEHLQRNTFISSLFFFFISSRYFIQKCKLEILQTCSPQNQPCGFFCVACFFLKKDSTFLFEKGKKLLSLIDFVNKLENTR